jgi:hypothetical protein
MPAKAGIQNLKRHNDWIPVFTGVTVKKKPAKENCAKGQ